MKIKFTIWIILTFIGLATHELIDEFIRPEYGKGDGTLAFLLGIAPNFLASAFIFPFGVLTVRDFYITPRQQNNKVNLNRWFWLGLIGSQIGLIVWEFIQKVGNLVFDINDIFTTLLGGLFAIGVYFFCRKKFLKMH